MKVIVTVEIEAQPRPLRTRIKPRNGNQYGSIPTTCSSLRSDGVTVSRQNQIRHSFAAKGITRCAQHDHCLGCHGAIRPWCNMCQQIPVRATARRFAVPSPRLSRLHNGNSRFLLIFEQNAQCRTVLLISWVPLRAGRVMVRHNPHRDRFPLFVSALPEHVVSECSS